MMLKDKIKIAYIFLSHDDIEPFQYKISKINNDLIDIFILNANIFYNENKKFILFDCEKYGYHEDQKPVHYVGNSIFPILDFYEKHNDYNFYIIHEYDCVYNGNINELIDNIVYDLQNNDIDYIIQSEFCDCKNWFWYNHTEENKINLNGLNPTHILFNWYCVSNDVLKYIYDKYSNNEVYGHYELILSSILSNSKFNFTTLNNYCECDMNYLGDCSNFVINIPDNKVFYHPVKF